MGTAKNIKKIMYETSGYRGFVITRTKIIDVDNMTYCEYESSTEDDKQDYDDPIYGKLLSLRKIVKKKEFLELLSKLRVLVDEWKPITSFEKMMMYDGHSWTLNFKFDDDTFKTIKGFCSQPGDFEKFSGLFFQMAEL